MKTTTPLKDNLYMAWTIASKDIVDALKNKTTLVNIILMAGIVIFFYWTSTPRPFDKRIDVALYDEGTSSLTYDTAELGDGYSFRFSRASSIQEMEMIMGYKQLGVVIPADFDQVLASGGEPTLTGYILWVHRADAADLEEKYAQKFTELFGQTVHLSIGENFIVPQPDVETSTVYFTILYATLWMALTIVPHLMIEEKRTRTMEALLISPASAGQVVMGKALAGLFYVLLSGGLFFALNWANVTNWSLATISFLLVSLFSVGLALVVGSIVKTAQQLSIWMIPIVVIFLIPGFFANEPFLAPSLKTIFKWIPTTAMIQLTKFSFSSSAPPAQLLTNLAIALVGIGLVYAVVVWQVRRSDR
jgi:ABC-type Na+ efflux pump permease subunit